MVWSASNLGGLSLWNFGIVNWHINVHKLLSKRQQNMAQELSGTTPVRRFRTAFSNIFEMDWTATAWSCTPQGQFNCSFLRIPFKSIMHVIWFGMSFGKLQHERNSYSILVYIWYINVHYTFLSCSQQLNLSWLQEVFEESRRRGSGLSSGPRRFDLCSAHAWLVFYHFIPWRSYCTSC